MSQTSTPPAMPQTKSSKSFLIVWAILATIAALFFALVAVVEFATIGNLSNNLNQASRLQIPVSVNVRPASLDNSLVAQLRNNSGQTLKVLVTIQSQTSGGKTQEVLIAANEIVEIGWAEGWRFVSGESLLLHHPDYKDMTYNIP